MTIKPYYETELGKLYHGDCLEIMPMLEPVDLVITSPPYDELRRYEGYSFDFKGTANKLFKMTKDNGLVVWIVADATINGNQTGTSFKQALYFKEVGFNLHDTMIWNKGGFTSPQTVRYPKCFEYMFVFSKGSIVCNQIKDRRNKKAGSASIHTIRKKDGKTKNMYADSRKTKIGKIGVRFNVWEIYPEQSSKKRRHPAPFPQQLAQDHVVSWSNNGSVVADIMCGGGTTPVVCERLNRNWIGIEISEKYCEIAAKRIEQERKQLKLF